MVDTLSLLQIRDTCLTILDRRSCFRSQDVDAQGQPCDDLRAAVQGGSHGGGEEHQAPQAPGNGEHPQPSGTPIAINFPSLRTEHI